MKKRINIIFLVILIIFLSSCSSNNVNYIEKNYDTSVVEINIQEINNKLVYSLKEKNKDHYVLYYDDEEIILEGKPERALEICGRLLYSVVMDDFTEYFIFDGNRYNVDFKKEKNYRCYEDKVMYLKQGKIYLDDSIYISSKLGSIESFEIINGKIAYLLYNSGIIYNELEYKDSFSENINIKEFFTLNNNLGYIVEDSSNLEYIYYNKKFYGKEFQLSSLNSKNIYYYNDNLYYEGYKKSENKVKLYKNNELFKDLGYLGTYSYSFSDNEDFAYYFNNKLYINNDLIESDLVFKGFLVFNSKDDFKYLAESETGKLFIISQNLKSKLPDSKLEYFNIELINNKIVYYFRESNKITFKIEE